MVLLLEPIENGIDAEVRKYLLDRPEEHELLISECCRGVYPSCA